MKKLVLGPWFEWVGEYRLRDCVGFGFGFGFGCRKGRRRLRGASA